MRQFEKDKVSICIPTYNGAEYILETMESVLKQDYENMEIIINDDCSPDNTLELVRTIHDQRVTVLVNEKRLGLVGNWNKTVSYARGEYVKLMCQDDLLCEHAIKSQVRILKENPGAALAIGNTYVINSAGKIVMKRKRFKEDRIADGKKYAMKSLRGRNIYSEPPNILYRTKSFYDAGFYDEELAYTPDWDFGIRLSYLGNIACSKNYIMKFRISGASETYRLYTKKLCQTVRDSVLLIKKHQRLGILKIRWADILLFRVMIWAGAVLRFIFIRWRNF